MITDLALILLFAGITTLICKKLKQPVIIGYILAGFLLSPMVGFFPNMGNTEEISVLAEIGVIFLMFSLGLEFNLHKMAKVGVSGTLSAIIHIIGMGLLGYLIGLLLGWSHTDSLFLGGMLSMSSTIITIKSLEDAKMREAKFTRLAIGTLIIEDIAAVFLMLILSTAAASRGSGETLLITIGVLLFYLALWLVLGIFIIPTVIKKIHHLMNNETLLIVTLAICFGMVWMADAIGFSAALGAFMAGSLLAGTGVAGRTEKLVAPCKDLFVAVFFVSVGFLVDPATLFSYIIPILILIAVTIVGKVIFLTGAYLLTRQSIHTAVHGAFAQTQIGEFSFVIASLGLSLGVTGDFLYPVIVAVAVITTLTTPFMLKAAPSFAAFLEKRLPDPMLRAIAANSKVAVEEENKKSKKRETWNRCLKHYFSRTALYLLLVAGIIVLGHQVLLPFALSYFPDKITKIAVIAFLYLCLLPFLPQLLISHDPDFTALWMQDRFNKLPLLILMGLRFAITLAALIIIPVLFYNTTYFWLLLFTIPLAFLAARSKRLRGSYLRIAAKFLANLNEHQLREKSEVKDLLWMDSDLLVDTYRIPANSALVSRSLENLQWGRTLHLNIIKIIRGKRHLNLPTGKESLNEGDVFYLFGAAGSIDNFRLIYGDTAVERLNRENVTLYQYIMHQDEFNEKDQLFCYGALVHKNSPFTGKSIRDSGLRKECNCFIIGVERDLYPIRDPSPNFILRTGDIIWLLGSVYTVTQLIQDEAILDESYTLGKNEA